MKKIWMTLLAALLLSAPLSAADLTGAWLFTWYTPDGPLESRLEFVQEGEKLTAKFDEHELKGSVREGYFRLKGEYFAPPAGYSAVLEFSGTEEDGGLTGKGSWDVHDLTFTAVRAD